MRAISCLDRFTRNCMRSGFKKSLMLSAVTHMKTELTNSFCTSDSDNQFGRTIHYCLDREVAPIDIMHSCVDKYINMLLHVGRNARTDQEHYSSRCCAFNYLRQCARDYAEYQCEHVAPGATSILESFVVRMFNQLTQCTQFHTTWHVCKHIPSGTILSFNRIGQSETPPMDNSSVLFTFLDVLQ